MKCGNVYVHYIPDVGENQGGFYCLDDMSCTKEIMNTLIKTMEIQEGPISENTIFIVEWDPLTFIEL